jgi:hypothetical protein
MINNADLVGLTEEQTRRFEEIDRDISLTREGIAVWHRLLDRRRLDRKQGLHPITEFAVDGKPAGREQGTLVKRSPEAEASVATEREPFYVRSETEARALLIRCIGYLSNAAGEKFAFDKGYGDRDKMAEWIVNEIKERGAITYIRTHSPYVFGIPIAAAGA